MKMTLANLSNAPKCKEILKTNDQCRNRASIDGYCMAHWKKHFYKPRKNEPKRLND